MTTVQGTELKRECLVLQAIYITYIHKRVTCAMGMHIKLILRIN